MRRGAIVLAVVFAAGGSGSAMTAANENPPPAKRDCKPVLKQTLYVGVSGGVSCKTGRRLARRRVTGEGINADVWRCTPPRDPFGHCHGKARRDGQLVQWAVND